MKKLLKLISYLLAIVTVISLVACGGTKDKSATDRGKTYEWKMVTTWPKDFPGLGVGANNFTKTIEEITGGQLKIKVYGAGELVGALEVFDAVSRGTAEMGHSAAYYWKGKGIDEVQFFTSIPFGLTAQEMNAWLYYGGGMELWEEAYAKKGLVPLSAGNTGVQMGGWFNKEIKSLDDLKGLKMRLPGLAAETLKRLGGIPVLLPGGEIFQALQSGALDATEWVGPYNDLAFGLYKAAKYYYYPGWHEPGSTMESFVNKEAFDALPPHLQKAIKVAAKASTIDMLSDFTAKNNAALVELVENHGVQLRKYPDDVLKQLAETVDVLYEELAAENPQIAKVWKSVKAFREQSIDYHNISERAYLNARHNIYRN